MINPQPFLPFNISPPTVTRVYSPVMVRTLLNSESTTKSSSSLEEVGGFCGLRTESDIR